MEQWTAVLHEADRQAYYEETRQNECYVSCESILRKMALGKCPHSDFLLKDRIQVGLEPNVFANLMTVRITLVPYILILDIFSYHTQ